MDASDSHTMLFSGKLLSAAVGLCTTQFFQGRKDIRLTHTVASRVFAQVYELAPSSYTDPATGISFETWSTPGVDGIGPFSFGLALPAEATATDATEYIGRLVG